MCKSGLDQGAAGMQLRRCLVLAGKAQLRQDGLKRYPVAQLRVERATGYAESRNGRRDKRPQKPLETAGGLIGSGLRYALAAGGSFCHASLLRSEEHTSELQSRENLVCRLLLEKKK